MYPSEAAFSAFPGGGTEEPLVLEGGGGVEIAWTSGEYGGSSTAAEGSLTCSPSVTFGDTGLLVTWVVEALRDSGCDLTASGAMRYIHLKLEDQTIEIYRGKFEKALTSGRVDRLYCVGQLYFPKMVMFERRSSKVKSGGFHTHLIEGLSKAAVEMPQY